MRRILISVLFVLLISCAKQEINKGDESKLILDVSVNPGADSKAVILESNYDEDFTMGLFVYHSETEEIESPTLTQFDLYGTKYRNIKVQYVGGKETPWLFNFEGFSNPFKSLYLLEPAEEVYTSGLTIVAYAPWVSGADIITNIPFTIGGRAEELSDLMWASQNSPQKGTNYKIIPNGEDKTVVLTFNHALSLINLGFKCKNPGSLITLSSVVLRNISDQTPLCSKGSFNAMNGTITSTHFTSEVEFDFTADLVQNAVQFSSTDEYVYVPILICPVEYKGGYQLEFNFNGLDDKENKVVYEITPEDVNEEFLSGNAYNFKFTLDNYIQFEGVSISSGFVDGGKYEIKF